MATSLDVPSSQTSADGQNSVYVFGDPKIEGRLIKIEFKEILLIETNLKDVNSRLTSVFCMMTNRGFRNFPEDEIEKIQLKVDGIILQLSKLNIMQVDMGNWERQAREKMDENFKEIKRAYLNRMEILFRSQKLKFIGNEEVEIFFLRCIEIIGSKLAGLQLQKLELPPVLGPSAACEEQVSSDNKTEKEEKKSSVPSEESNAVDDRPPASSIVIGDPKIEEFRLKIDEIALIETDLQDVNLRLTTAFEMMPKHAGFDPFLENEMKKILLKVEESIALVSTLIIIRQMKLREKMNERFKKIEEMHLVSLEDLLQLKFYFLDALDSFLECRPTENIGLNAAAGLQLQRSERPPVSGPSGEHSVESEEENVSEKIEKLLEELQESEYSFLERIKNMGMKATSLKFQGNDGSKIPSVPGPSGYHSDPSEAQDVSEELGKLLEEFKQHQRSEQPPVLGPFGDSQSPAASEEQGVLEGMEKSFEELRYSFLKRTENIGLKAAGLQLQGNDGLEIPSIPAGPSGYHSAPSEAQGVSEEVEKLWEEFIQLQISEQPPGPSGDSLAASEEQSVLDGMGKFLEEMQYSFLKPAATSRKRSLSGYHSAPSEAQGVSEEIGKLLEEFKQLQRSELPPAAGPSGNDPDASEEEIASEDENSFPNEESIIIVGDDNSSSEEDIYGSKKKKKRL